MANSSLGRYSFFFLNDAWLVVLQNMIKKHLVKFSFPVSWKIIAFALGISLIGLGVFTNVKPSSASNSEQTGTVQEVSNELCLNCHETPETFIEFRSAERLDLFVDGTVYNASVHGIQGTTCVQCHTNISGYPHPDLDAATQREFTIQQNQACGDCHTENFQSTLDGVHQAARKEGNLNAAVCSDCHGAHDVSTASIRRSNIPQLCGECHTQIFELYKTSVHGGALLEEGNPDTPTCTDCHGIHEIGGPSQEGFHLFSPLICANCHTDNAITEKYGLNPYVYETYLSDFHGTTVTLFEKIAPDQQTNKPVCIDCHGVHDIRRTDDPKSTVIRENLLDTCQQCHPNATEDFPSAWLGHYSPSWEKTPVISAVNLFYQIVIPVTVIGMLVIIIPDGFRRIRKRSNKDNS